MKKYSYLFPYLIICLALAAGYAIAWGGEAGAQKISFPVAELGNCGSEAECKTFCDDDSNISVCVNFAEKNGLMSVKEAAKARKFSQAGAGPGGCRGRACQAYCEDTSHLDECLDFASRNGLMDTQEFQEAKKVVQVLKSGGSLPGGCKSKSECETYCNDFSHTEECFAFAEKAGFIPPEELRDARKAMEVMKQGIRPPGNCRGKAECERFCSHPENVEECFAFAERAGFIPPEELEQARKIIPLMKAGKMPGGCKSKEACEAYCEDESNLEVCANFAIEAGFMKPEEAEMFRKTGGKGPGGCKGRACESFCDDPANQEACFSFAQEHGLIPEEELEQMREGMSQFREGLDSAPPEVADCLKSSLGSEAFDKLQSGQSMPGRQMGEAMRNCFEQSARDRFEGGEGEGFGPPGGFDESEFEEGGFGPPRGFERGEGFGPPPGVSPEDFERFREEGGFPGGGPSPSSGRSDSESLQTRTRSSRGGFPSEEEIEKFQRGEFNQEDFNQGGFEGGRGPSPEQIQGVIQQRTQERTQEIIKQRTQEQMERFGAPAGEGNFGQPSGSPSPSSGSGEFGPSTGSGQVPAPSEFQQQFQQQFQQEFQQQIPSGGFEQFSPPPSGGGTTVPPPTSSALDAILSPFVKLLGR